jgi:N6-L-threonylcarbamoyladenine synthase
MIVLGIESSCDETAVGIVRDGNELLANSVFSSMDLHKAYGGVVPEIAARSHIESIMPVLDEALETAFPGVSTDEKWDNVDAIAVTYGAGLGGSLLVGVMTAKTLAVTKNKPLYAINHVEAHVYANFLTKTSLSGYTLPNYQPEFPLLALIVSGGHSQLVLFRNHFDYTLLGQTRDDAIGEAFDKVAKVIGLPYPGGPSIAEAAKKGDATKYNIPKAKLDHPYEYSFSGPKTAVLRLAQEEIGEDYTFPSYQIAERLSERQKYDIAASFQRVAVETVVDKTIQAFKELNPKSVVIAGGVAANQELRRQLAERLPISIEYTDIKLCTDNGAMIATLGCYKTMNSKPTSDPYSLQIEPNLSM